MLREITGSRLQKIRRPAWLDAVVSQDSFARTSCAMTESRNALSAAARKRIIAGLSEALAVFDRTGRDLSTAEETVRTNLRRIRRELEEQGDRRRDAPDP